MNTFYTDVDPIFHDWNYSTPKTLYGLIRTLKPSIVIEAGCYRGYSSAWMAKACQENNHGRVIAIDDFSLKQFTPDREKAIAHFWHNLQRLGVRDLVTLIEGKTSEVQWPGQVDFAYIDGWHGYQAVRHDFDKCAAAGAECICLDDAEQAVGPRMLVQELRAGEYWDVINVHRDCGMAVCMRRMKLGPVIFSQELPDNPGVDLTALTKEGQLRHLGEANAVTGVDYGPVLPHLHRGK